MRLLIFSIRFWGFQLIAGVSDPQNHGVGHALLGKESACVLSDKYAAQKSASPPTVVQYCD